jgi:hypothetical protein
MEEAAPMPARTALAPLLAFALLLWPGLVPAQEPAALRGVTQTRLVLGIAAEAGAREACGLTPEAEERLFEAARANALPTGLAGPESVAPRRASGLQSWLAGAGGEPGMPLLTFSASVAHVPAGEQVLCAMMLVARFEVVLRGGRTVPGDQPLDGPLIVWLFDAIELSPAAEFVARSAETVAAVSTIFAESWRRDN